MHRAGAGAPYRVNDVLSAKVAVSSSVRAYSERLVCLCHMQCILIAIRIDSGARNAQALGRAHDAARDLSAVRDQQFVKHQR